MIISIHPQLTLSEIKTMFHEQYPFLKICFFTKSHGWQESVTGVIEYDDKSTVKEATSIPAEGIMEIHYWQKTGAVEHEFSSRFHLHAQIYRRQNGVWVQTAGTDELTLEEQNEIGMKGEEPNLHGNGAGSWKEKRI
jgi:hypothetical protein